MTDTTNLGLPCIEGSQAQKHVTHNEALHILDTLVQLAVLDRDLTAPPGSPAEGQRWIVKATGTGAWAGRDDNIAAWQDGAWQFSTPQTGWLAYVVDEGALLAWTGSAWADAITALTSLNNMTLLGVGTTADATNPFSVKLNNTLAVAKTVAEGGTGDLRYKLSKESAAKTLSLLFQDNFSGRAELGLTGDDDFHFKVSSDGTTWREAIVIDRTTGNAQIADSIATPGGRLTLATATPVMTASVGAATMIYYSPYLHDKIPIYDGTAWRPTRFAELSNVTGNSSTGKAGPAAVANNKNYDLFVWSDAGTVRLTRGPAWTSDTARGTGAGTAELQRTNGIWTNKVAITNGPDAGLGTYVGTVRSNGSAQIDWKLGGLSTGGTAGFLGVWNLYNRVGVPVTVSDSTDSWTYATAAWRAAGNNTTMRVSYVCGLAEDCVFVFYAGAASGSGGEVWGVGYDSASAFSGTVGYGAGTVAVFGNANFMTTSLGFHFVQAIEYQQSGTGTYYGDAGSAYFQSGLFLQGRF